MARAACGDVVSPAGIGQPAGEPVGQVGVGQFHHRFQRVELRLAVSGDVPRDEAADQQVVLVRAAMGGAEQQAAAARVERSMAWVLVRVIGGVSYSARHQPHVSRANTIPCCPLFAPLTTLHGVGPTVARAAGTRRRRRAGARPAVSSARSAIVGPARPADYRRCRSPARSPPWRSRWCATRRPPTPPPALAGHGDRRHRLRRAGVLPLHAASGSCRSGARLLVSGKAGALRRPADACRTPTTSCRPTRAGAAGDRAGLAADRRAVAPPGGARHGAGAASACPTCRNGMTRRCCGARAGRASPRRCARAQAPDGAAGRRRPRLRLAYDELLADQSRWRWCAAACAQRPGRAADRRRAAAAQALARFGHQPTPSQASALAEIDADLAAPRRMLRLLQGDVGSGKTLVALLAMLRAVEAGAQAALMAPTEVLAQAAPPHAVARCRRCRWRC